MKLVNWFFRRRRYASPWQRRLVRLRALSCCEYCGRWTPDDQANVDHIVPWSQGGWSSLLNFAYCCEGCNALKGNRRPQQWRPVAFRNFRKGAPS